MRRRCGKRRSMKDEPHNHCLGCGYPVAAYESWCGECVCEVEGP